MNNFFSVTTCKGECGKFLAKTALQVAEYVEVNNLTKCLPYRIDNIEITDITETEINYLEYTSTDRNKNIIPYFAAGAEKELNIIRLRASALEKLTDQEKQALGL